ncbi:hypothetical protein ACJ41O_010570 [Fusarium nematophilum]
MDQPCNPYVVAGFTIIYLALLGYFVSITISLSRDERGRRRQRQPVRHGKRVFPWMDAIRETEAVEDDENEGVPRRWAAAEGQVVEEPEM